MTGTLVHLLPRNHLQRVIEVLFRQRHQATRSGGAIDAMTLPHVPRQTVCR